MPPGNALERALDPDHAAWMTGQITPYILAKLAGVATPGEEARTSAKGRRQRLSTPRTEQTAQQDDTGPTAPADPNPEAVGQLVPGFGGDRVKQARAYQELLRRKGGNADG